MLQFSLSNELSIHSDATPDDDHQVFRVAPPDVIIKLKQARLSAKDKNDIEGLQKLLENSGS